MTQKLLKQIAVISLSLVCVFALSVAFLGSSLPAYSQSNDTPVFSPDYIMSDQTFTSMRVFPTEESVQAYLDRIGSPLRNYEDNGKLASYWIFAASQGITSSNYGITPKINPGVILAILEKEMSLLTNKGYDVKGDPEGRIKTAMGYGCPDSAGCNPEYSGFSNQVNWAAFQLQFNFQGAAKKSSSTAPYNVDNQITTLDQYTFKINNAATAVCYRYTPHVYFGCYNLWKIITTNGWGVSPQTFSTSEIDKVNLNNTSNFGSNVAQVKLSEAEGQALVSQTFTIGQQGESVRKLQVFLRQKNLFNNQNITGYFGPITSEGLNKYRQQNSVVAGGFKSMSDNDCRNLINQNFTYGQTGDAVTNLQKCLTDIGFFDSYNITGFYGSITTAAQKSALPLYKTNSTPTPPQANPSPQPQAPSNQAASSTGLSNLCQSTLGKSYTIGMSGQNVRDIQQCLKDIGLYAWPSGVTGYYGSYTNGKYNEWLNSGKTVCAMLKIQSWKQGETSERVKRLQQCMREAGKFTYSSNTGYFGPITNTAWQAWK